MSLYDHLIVEHRRLFACLERLLLAQYDTTPDIAIISAELAERLAKQARAVYAAWKLEATCQGRGKSGPIEAIMSEILSVEEDLQRRLDQEYKAE